jgi:hypothetical protein
VSVTCGPEAGRGADREGEGEARFGTISSRVGPDPPEGAAEADPDSAVVLAVVGSLAMSLIITTMISSTAVVTQVSSHSIERCTS